ncbi:MlaD family protein [Vibrio metschnikovii]
MGLSALLVKAEETVLERYSLYANPSLAELAAYQQSGSRALRLSADTLPPVQIGSPLLFRHLPVGHVTQFKLQNEGVEVEVSIDNQYQHLINEQTVFWNHSGIVSKCLFNRWSAYPSGTVTKPAPRWYCL